MKDLLLLNYAMDESDSVFPHQIKIARLLSQEFRNVYVLTTIFKEPKDPLPENMQVSVVNWQKSALSNAIRIYLAFGKILIKNRSLVIFSHMTEVQSALLAPFAKILGLRHYLWYAHASRSIYLSWNNIWVDKILTSTKGSCPIDSKKVRIIGQGVDETLFRFNSTLPSPKQTKWIHVGRVDPSKRIDFLIRQFLELFGTKSNNKFVLVGVSSLRMQDYYKQCQELVASNEGQVEFLGGLSHQEIYKELCGAGIFVHAFQGSLDKTLIEATLTGIPVVTCNREYLREFGRLSACALCLSDQEIFRCELLAILNMDKGKIEEIRNRRSLIARQKHSQTQWISALIKELQT
jgi:glycosyltransferase involved in cell wall biosynthesis